MCSGGMRRGGSPRLSTSRRRYRSNDACSGSKRRTAFPACSDASDCLTMTTELRIGTRGSQLALWQANTVAARIAAAGGPPCRIVVIKTSGDRRQDAPLSEIGGKRLFVKEIEDALLAGEIDLAVHSSKDMPAVLPSGLDIVSVLPREDALDAIVLPRAARDEPATGNNV